MKYLDVERLMNEDVDPLLRDLLTKVKERDTVRRLQVAFPEFFTDKMDQHTRMPRAWLAERRDAVKDYGDEPDEICEWFGITCVQFVQRREGVLSPDDTDNLLPQDFRLERDESYDGYKDDPWIITLTHKGSKKPEALLVLEVLVGQDNDNYFLYTVRWRNMCAEFEGS